MNLTDLATKIRTVFGKSGSLNLIDMADTVSSGTIVDCSKTLQVLISRDSTYKTLNIPNGISVIRNYAFFFYTALTSVTIPDGVTTIGNNAFNWCTGLTSVTIPSSVTTIDYGAFG